MRLFLLPISTRRTLIYCQHLNVQTQTQSGLIDKGVSRAAALWASWEKKESGWQKKLVVYGNSALKRIPFEEWGLKSIPPLSARRQEEELKAETGKVEVHFPEKLISQRSILDLLGKLGSERQSFHKSRITYCFIGMPLVAPFALVPVIPNIPFFYLCYRAWSHWRALSGSKHIMFLVEKNLISSNPSPILERLYSEGANFKMLSSKSLAAEKDPSRDTSGEPDETMILSPGSAGTIAKALDVPELEVELDRAIWQVEKSIKENEEKLEVKASLDKAAAAETKLAKAKGDEEKKST